MKNRFVPRIAYLAIACLVAFLPQSFVQADLFMVQQGSNTNDTLLQYDIGTATLSTVGSIGFGDVRGLAYDEGSDTLYGVARGVGSTNIPRLIEIDRFTGLGTAVSASPYLPPNSNTAEISVDAAGNMFGLGRTGSYSSPDTILSVNKTTGVATPINPGGITTSSVAGLAFDHGSGNLYGSSYFGQLLAIDPVLGTQSSLGSMTGGSNIARIVFEQDLGVLYGISASNNLYTIDLGSLAATNVDSFSGSQIYSIASAPRTMNVPEPSCAGLLLGAACLFLGRRKR